MKIKFQISFVLLFFQFTLGWAQIAPNTYWISFSDKNSNGYSLDKPEQFLSQRAILRRQKQSIPIDSLDLPVSKTYTDSLTALGLRVINTSRWLNGASIYSTNPLLIDTLHKYTFIAHAIERPNTSNNAKMSRNKQLVSPNPQVKYGFSDVQIEMVNGQNLHHAKYNGEGMLVGVQDAGFTNAKQIESLSHIWDDGQIIASRDFVKDSFGMFEAHTHGTLVLSIMAGVIPNQLYGSAPNANYVLVRTEKGSSEYILEEYNWISGAEFCDSIGVDVINSSLGYSEFDDQNQNHAYADMDGKTTPISIGAKIAARKGILVVTGAGNLGDDTWQHITAPGDTDSILVIGAVDSERQIADFSSKGPTSDGRIKPDVSVQGVETASQTNAGTISGCTGTSCAAPLLTGMATCLWQSRPKASAQQIRTAIIRSSDRFSSPDTLYGFGIPDFVVAQMLLDSILGNSNELTHISINPNIILEYAQLQLILPWLSKHTNGQIGIYDVNGRLLKISEHLFYKDLTIIPFKFNEFNAGYYILKVKVAGRNYQLPFIKRPG